MTKREDDPDGHDAGAMYRRTAPRLPVTGVGQPLQTDVTPGLRRADEDLVRDVETRLRHDEADTDAIEVSCDDGVVTLSGAVRDEQQHERVTGVAERVSGVRDVVDEVRVEHGVLRRFLDGVDTDGEIHADGPRASKHEETRRPLCRASPSAEARGLGKCSHAPCSCPVEKGQDYCSEECHRAALAGHNDQMCACRCGAEAS